MNQESLKFTLGEKITVKYCVPCDKFYLETDVEQNYCALCGKGLNSKTSAKTVVESIDKEKGVVNFGSYRD